MTSSDDIPSCFYTRISLVSEAMVVKRVTCFKRCRYDASAPHKNAAFGDIDDTSQTYVCRKEAAVKSTYQYANTCRS